VRLHGPRVVFRLFIFYFLFRGFFSRLKGPRRPGPCWGLS
jgi:hypothetical protein